MNADLHMHTTDSDGTKSFEEVIDIAVEKNLDIISITDHDNCTNYEEKIKYAIKKGITLIPGIEVSTKYKKQSVHVLGYFKNDGYNNEEVIEFFENIKKKRRNRINQYLLNIKIKYNYDISYNDVLSLSKGAVARPHIAKALINKYPHLTHDFIFSTILNADNDIYIPSSNVSVQEAIDLLHRNGAIAVLAHPTLIKKELLLDILEHDFDGIEAYYFLNKEKDDMYFSSIARKIGLIVTGGSDYHGIENDSKHGDIGEIFISGIDVDQFLTKLKY